MTFPNPAFWSHMLATVGVEVCGLAALGFAAQRVFRRAYWQRAVWQITVLCLLLVCASEWTGFGRGMAGSLFGRERALKSAPARGGRAVKTTEVAVGVPTLALNQPVAAPSPPLWWPGWIWLAGTAIVLGRVAAGQCLLLALRFRRERIVIGPLPERIRGLANRIGLRRKICLLRLPEAMSPMASGLLRPSVGLPAGFEAEFTATEQEAILAHELAHLAAMDPLWFLMANFACAVLWWHPLVWWVRRSLHVSSEMAADEASALVPDGPDLLAKCLVALGKKMTARRGWGWVGISGGFRSKLGKRVDRLMRISGVADGPPAGWRNAAARIAVTMLVVPTVVLLFGAFQRAEGQQDSGWRESWHSSPGALLLLAALDNAGKPKESITTLVQDAKLFFGMGKLDEAESILVDVLKEDPANRTAPYYLDLIREARFERNGGTDKPKESIAARVQTAKLEYESGKLDEADKILAAVLKDDPKNRTALYYVDMIKEARFMSRAHETPTGPTNIPLYPTKGRQNILSKLESIRFDKVEYNLPLTEVLSRLTFESQKRDPAGLGVRFLIDPHVDAGAGTVSVSGGAPAVDMSTVTVKISPPLLNLRLMDVLNAITMTADHPIRYTVEDYAVVFSPKPDEPTTLYTKVFHVDPNTFGKKLRTREAASVNPGSATGSHGNEIDDGVRAADEGHDSFGGPGSPNIRYNPPAKTNESLQLDQMLRSYFTAAGVDMTEPGKSLFFNDRRGLLMVRASADDLAIIEQAVETLNPSEPQVMITARFVELSQKDSVALGFNWFLQGAGNPTLGGVMSDAQCRLAINAIEQRTGSDLPAAPKVTTLSGRQAHFAAKDLQETVTGTPLNATGSSTGGVTGGTGVLANQIGSTPTFPPSLGPALDVYPTVSADGFTIQMVLIPTYTELLQFDSSGAFIPQAPSAAGSSIGVPLQAQLPLPHFRVHQGVTKCNVWDGQTLVAGQLATNQPPDARRLRLYFVTPRIIDFAGNLVHTDDELSGKP